MKVAEPTIERIVHYYRLACRLENSDQKIISSQEIAERLNIKAAQVRKDLSYFGEIGKRGVGYKISELREHLEIVLDSPKRWKVALIGVGNLGMALIGHSDFYNEKFELTALFEIDQKKIGQKFFGIECYDAKEISRILREKEVEVIILAVPDKAAQRCVDAAVASGCLKGVLSFTSAQVTLPENIAYQRVDILAALEKLFFALKETE